MKSEKEMHLALVRGLLPCVMGECSRLDDSTVDWLDEGVCVIFCGVSQASQLSVVSLSVVSS
jgi:hypothetical protein